MLSNEIAHCSYQRDSNYPFCFYKSIPLKSSNILNRVQKTCKKFQEKPLPPQFKSRLDGPSAIWKVFNRLQVATTYADSCTKDCRIFSFEEKVGNVGQRKFLVAHPEQLWQIHRSRPAEERCTYEIIRENYPCKLYFDIEYYTAFNSEKNGIHMTNIFIKCVIAFMYERHGLFLKDSDFLWLDSSNESKFSCHLILQMTNVAFQNNIQAGTFVSALLSTLKKKIDGGAPSNDLWPSSGRIKTLLVKSKKETEVFFCDDSVYSRNRNFRMYLSTKYGKNCPLVLSSHNRYVPISDLKCKEEAIFYDSLVTYFRNNKRYTLLSYEEDIQLNFPLQRKEIRSNKSGTSGLSLSPFPELDSFILKIVTDDFAVGFIRKWTYLCNEQKIIYDIGNYRYCGNIGRHHKSNNIKIIVDMRIKCYYQKCLDPECRKENYQSESTPIPDDIPFINVPDDFFDTNCFSQLQPEENKENAIQALLDSHINDCDNFVTESNCKKALYDKCSEMSSTDVSDALMEEKIFWQLEFSDFSQLDKTDNSDMVSDGASNRQVQVNPEAVHDDWDAFFVDDFTLSEDKMKPEEQGDLNRDLSCLNNEDSWICSESLPKNSTASLGNVSAEEEMLMVEAADAAEVTMNEDIFSEETMF